MKQGFVKEYDEQRGFGFLVDESNHEIFVHQSHVELEEGQKLEEGMMVSFEVTAGAKAPQAIHVKMISEEE